MKTIAIIGGGAAGLSAAIAAGNEVARLGLEGACRIVLFEADPERIGRSILATGNGRCNFSNAHIDASLYRNAAFVDESLRALASDEGLSSLGRAGDARFGGGVAADPVHRFLGSLGLLWREEGEGRLYPSANKASSVLDVLRAALKASGAQIEFGKSLCAVEAPEQGRGRFHLRFSDGSIAHAEEVVLAVGGRGMDAVVMPPAIERVPMRPVLGPLRATPRIARQLNNIRVKCVVSLLRDGDTVAREEGELLFRDYGVSGVCVFNLSRTAQPGDTLSIDLLPQIAQDEKEPWLFARRKHLCASPSRDGAITVGEVLRGALLPQVAHVVARVAGTDEDAVIAKADVPALAYALGHLELVVEGIGDARQCQVMRGGLRVCAFDPQTMESLALPGLFAAGEALDVDAPCGGYNLHWAWSSGLIAGAFAVRRIVSGRTEEAAR